MRHFKAKITSHLREINAYDTNKHMCAHYYFQYWAYFLNTTGRL